MTAWNRLKDPGSVVRMFGEFVAPHSPAHLVIAGPAVEAIPAETEAEDVYNETSRASFPPAIRERVHVVAMPNDDPEEAGRDRERDSATVGRCAGEESRRGIRACRHGSDVEAAAGRFDQGWRPPGAGSRWRDRVLDRPMRQPAGGSDDPDPARRAGAR